MSRNIWKVYLRKLVSVSVAIFGLSCCTITFFSRSLSGTVSNDSWAKFALKNCTTDSQVVIYLYDWPNVYNATAKFFEVGPFTFDVKQRIVNSSWDSNQFRYQRVKTSSFNTIESKKNLSTVITHINYHLLILSRLIEKYNGSDALHERVFDYLTEGEKFFETSEAGHLFFKEIQTNSTKWAKFWPMNVTFNWFHHTLNESLEVWWTRSSSGRMLSLESAENSNATIYLNTSSNNADQLLYHYIPWICRKITLVKKETVSIYGLTGIKYVATNLGAVTVLQDSSCLSDTGPFSVMLYNIIGAQDDKLSESYIIIDYIHTYIHTFTPYPFRGWQRFLIIDSTTGVILESRLSFQVNAQLLHLPASFMVLRETVFPVFRLEETYRIPTAMISTSNPSYFKIFLYFIGLLSIASGAVIFLIPVEHSCFGNIPYLALLSGTDRT